MTAKAHSFDDFWPMLAEMKRFYDVLASQPRVGADTRVSAQQSLDLRQQALATGAAIRDEVQGLDAEMEALWQRFPHHAERWAQVQQAIVDAVSPLAEAFDQWEQMRAAMGAFQPLSPEAIAQALALQRQLEAHDIAWR